MIDISKMQNLVPQDGIESGISVAFPFLALRDNAGVRCGVSHLKPGKLESALTYDEVLYLLEGDVTMESDGQKYPLAAGEAVWMPANRTITYHVKVASRLFYVIPAVKAS